MHCKLNAKKKEFINQKMEFEFDHSFLLEYIVLLHVLEVDRSSLSHAKRRARRSSSSSQEKKKNSRERICGLNLR